MHFESYRHCSVGHLQWSSFSKDTVFLWNRHLQWPILSKVFSWFNHNSFSHPFIEQPFFTFIKQQLQPWILYCTFSEQELLQGYIINTKYGEYFLLGRYLLKKGLVRIWRVLRLSEKSNCSLTFLKMLVYSTELVAVIFV